MEVDTLTTLTRLTAGAISRAWHAAERATAEQDLRKSDTILRTLTKAASDLLGRQDYDSAINDALASVGRTLNLDRVLLLPFDSPDGDSTRFVFSHEWHDPRFPAIRGRGSVI